MKGLYHVNLVDEVTQWRHVGTVEGISEHFLVPVLEDLIKAFPFEGNGFYADNGSKYFNHRVARLLNAVPRTGGSPLKAECRVQMPPGAVLHLFGGGGRPSATLN